MFRSAVACPCDQRKYRERATLVHETDFIASTGSPLTKLRDVARHADVSAATTSRALSGKVFVSDELRRRVVKAAEELNYSPNGVARSMSLGRTLALGLVVPDVRNPFFTSVARGVEDAGQRAGYTVVLCNSDQRVEKESAYLSVLREQRVSGIILAPSGHEATDIRRLVGAGMTVVLIDRAMPELGVSSVLVDNFAGAQRATQYLLDLGHRRIGVIAGAPDVSTARERVEGYTAALAEAGVSFDPTLVLYGDSKEETGHSGTLQLWSRSDRPTAIISLSNVMTTGSLLALRQRGARIPEDVSVISFDDLPYFELLAPPLTAIAQPTYEVGQCAGELLLDRIESGGNLASEPQEVRLPARLIVRGSCRRLAAESGRVQNVHEESDSSARPRLAPREGANASNPNKLEKEAIHRV